MYGFHMIPPTCALNLAEPVSLFYDHIDSDYSQSNSYIDFNQFSERNSKHIQIGDGESHNSVNQKLLNIP